MINANHVLLIAYNARMLKKIVCNVREIELMPQLVLVQSNIMKI